MSNRISALAQILGSPIRVLALVLMLVFTVEVAVMFVLPYVVPGSLGEAGRAVLDAVLLTSVCAPLLWWVIIGPLRRIAIQEHERSETIVSNASEGIITFDRRLCVTSSNKAGADLLGFTDSAEVIGTSLGHRIPQFPSSLTTFPSEYLRTVVRPDGSSIPVQISVSEYPSEAGQLMIAVVRDLTESQQAEQEKIRMARETEALRAQQMTTLAQLATGVSHEIRNPLTSIKMLIQVNRAKFAEEGLPTDDLALVEQEIRRMERSVNGLLEYARPEKSEFAEFSVQEVVRSTIQLVDGRFTAQQVRIVIDAPPDDVHVNGDAAQIRQLMLNLSLNALDAMPHGGELIITISPASDNSVTISVCDTGQGIDANIADKLFSPFVTTKPNGIGLGLGICKRIAEAHQGTLRGRNRDEGGAEFLLTLPTSCPEDQTADAISSSEDSCKAC